MSVERGSVNGLSVDWNIEGNIVFTPIKVPIADDLLVRPAGLGRPQFVNKQPNIEATQTAAQPSKTIQAPTLV